MQTLPELLRVISQIDEVGSDAFIAALSAVQERIGKNDEGFAGMFFFASRWRHIDDTARLKDLVEYVTFELTHAVRGL